MADCPSWRVALEGPCCAGKTTLGNGLIGDLAGMTVAHVRDYSDYVGGGRFLPPPVPTSLAEEEQALAEFLRIEADRTKHLRSSPAELVLIDRSVHTLIAHCRGLEHITGVDYTSLAERVLVQSSIPLWPDLVIYLDISHEVAKARNRNMGKFAAQSIFINPNFNLGIRLYFLYLTKVGLPRVIWLDATLDPLKLRSLAGAKLKETWRRHDEARRIE